MKGRQAQGSGLCTNHFYTLCTRQEVEKTPDITIELLKAFNFDVYALLDLGVNYILSYLFLKINLMYVLKFYYNLLFICTLIRESIVAKRVLKLSYVNLA